MQASLHYRHRFRLVVPFINTHPLTDLCWTLLLLPVWWSLGAEQFAPVALVGLATVKLLWLRGRVRLHPVLGLLAGFLLIQLVSALFIVEPFRYVTFARNFGMYLMAFGIVLVLINTVYSMREAHRVLSSLVWSLALAALMGLLGISGVARPQYSSLVGTILPDSIAGTGYGLQIAQRQIGNSAWFQWLGEYFRLDTFFLFSTMYAAALAIVLPIAIYFSLRARRAQRPLYILITGLLIVNLIFTTGRMAMLAFVLSGAYWFFRRKRSVVRLAWLAFASVVATAFLAVVPFERVTEGVEAALYARGSGSVISRTFIYERTLLGVLERPFFGWGTERDLVDAQHHFVYPAGSHSDVLGTLYKHGLVGLMAFLVLWWSLWRSSAPPPGATSEKREVLSFARWSILAAAVISLTSALNLDTNLMMVFWVIVGCACALGQRIFPAATTS